MLCVLLQVGIAFMAGLAFGIILIPINRKIANKIGELSTRMMAQKDARVKVSVPTYALRLDAITFAHLV
jgi:ATP-binding cassette subfamily C (CFTR/MRP) protein 10